MKRGIIVPTDLAVAFLEREGVTATQARSAIYRWSRQGLLPNHGKSGAGQALWDLAEVRELMWPRKPCVASKPDVH